MLDDDFEFGDDPYERIREQKPLKVRLRNFLYGCVVIGLEQIAKANPTFLEVRVTGRA